MSSYIGFVLFLSWFTRCHGLGCALVYGNRPEKACAWLAWFWNISCRLWQRTAYRACQTPCSVSLPKSCSCYKWFRASQIVCGAAVRPCKGFTGLGRVTYLCKGTGSQRGLYAGLQRASINGWRCVVSALLVSGLSRKGSMWP